ncbi:diacylglycerol kinase [Alkalibacterium pelagium]|uniref:Diacylglycerol kinase (ATP) n=1 Tax=Alkalibacterium pelagium TaxID=426702 RepID=A0A1H7F7L5_9LACT|nr:diacylglycerol kinase [Alkalibacterium pelagium]GEN49447.1 diacylglycerol kinase [Alkalibacterium pelagium]SEK22089.1 diacylglycerol kinase (ATP) [Alkalibacterium pelagium]
MRRRARIIYNPTSGRETLKRAIPDILNVYEKCGYETSAFCTTPTPLSAQNEADRCTKDGFDLIIAAGGDGTINEVINGIAPHESRPKLAIIPAGTTNDFARALNIPRNDFVRAAELINTHQFVKMDIGKVITASQERYFMNIGAAGSLTEVTYDVPANMKSVFGSLAYFVKGAELLPQIGKVPVSISYDDGIYEGTASMLFVALTNSVGGFEKIAPDKKLGDGKFTLIIVKTTNIAEILRLLTLVINDGRHVNHPKIIYTKTSTVKAEALVDKPLMINIDGEYGGDAPAEFVMYQQHLELVADLSGMSLSVNSRDTVTIEKESEFLEGVSQLEEE